MKYFVDKDPRALPRLPPQRRVQHQPPLPRITRRVDLLSRSRTRLQPVAARAQLRAPLHSDRTRRPQPQPGRQPRQRGAGAPKKASSLNSTFTELRTTSIHLSSSTFCKSMKIWSRTSSNGGVSRLTNWNR